MKILYILIFSVLFFVVFVVPSSHCQNGIHQMGQQQQQQSDSYATSDFAAAEVAVPETETKTSDNLTPNSRNIRSFISDGIYTIKDKRTVIPRKEFKNKLMDLLHVMSAYSFISRYILYLLDTKSFRYIF